MTRIIHRYTKNRRLYDTYDSRYTKVANLAKLVLEGQDFVVYAHPGEKDITKAVLGQLIAIRAPLLSRELLEGLIRASA